MCIQEKVNGWNRKEVFYQKIEKRMSYVRLILLKYCWGHLIAKIGREEMYRRLLERHSLHLNINNYRNLWI